MTEPSAAELYKAFTEPRYSKQHVAKMTESAAVNMVAHQRSAGALPGLSLTNDEIARRIQDYARLGGQDGEQVTDQALLARILEEEREQTRLLGSIRTMVALFWVVALLGLLASLFRGGMF